MSTNELSGELRVGIVGAGYIGRKVGREFVQDSRAVVAALADVDGGARDASGRALGVERDARYADHEAMLERERLDAVFVGTPHALHYEHVTAALDRGLDVLCDKPLTADLSRAKALVERVEASDQVLMVGYQRHLNEAFIQARERWADASREPTFVTAEITQDWVPQFVDTWRGDPALSGGGNLYDTGSHLLDAVLWTTGLTPRYVSAEMDFVDPDRRVDELAMVTIEFENGATANVSVFSDAPCVREHVHIWDEEGALYLEGRQWEDRKLTEVRDDSTDVVPYIDRERQRTKAEAFVDCVRNDETPPATARDAMYVTAVTEAAYESARTGERVEVAL